MRTVEYEGTRYLLVKRSGESSLVRNPNTGESRYLPNDVLTVTGDSPLETAARAVAESQRRILTAVHTDQHLGLLLELDDAGPLSVNALSSRYDLCESDLHGSLLELRAAGLVCEREVNGEPGYETTDLAKEGLSALR